MVHVVRVTRKGAVKETSFEDPDQARRFASGMRNIPGFGRPEKVETVEVPDAVYYADEEPASSALPCGGSS